MDSFNAHGSARATAMMECTATADSAPTEPKRLETLQVVRLSDTVEWSIVSSQLDWPDTADRLALGGGCARFKVPSVSEPDGSGGSIRVRRGLGWCPGWPAFRGILIEATHAVGRGRRLWLAKVARRRKHARQSPHFEGEQ